MVIAAGYTHKGRRENNEDSFLVCDNFSIVADGMGGHSKGEVASNMAVEHIKDYLNNLTEFNEKNLADAITLANKFILQKAASEKDMSDMGTTVVMCAWDKKEVYIANVGDSRCYLCSKNRVNQITTDHSYVQTLVDSGKITPEEAESRADKNILLRAVGCEEELKVDTFKLTIKKGDVLVLCSDGLSGVMSDKDIREIVMQDSSVEVVVKTLVDEAYKKGSTDNITAVIVKF